MKWAYSTNQEHGSRKESSQEAFTLIFLTYWWYQVSGLQEGMGLLGGSNVEWPIIQEVCLPHGSYPHWSVLAACPSIHSTIFRIPLVEVFLGPLGNSVSDSSNLFLVSFSASALRVSRLWIAFLAPWKLIFVPIPRLWPRHLPKSFLNGNYLDLLYKIFLGASVQFPWDPLTLQHRGL